jgi:ADP-ribose pyrophosphatase YjhB (NUDIX family)
MAEVPVVPKLAASACVWRAGEVLLIRRAQPPIGDAWSLPGGHVEAGETVMAAAARELLEETGVSARLETLVGVYDVLPRDAGGRLLAHYAICCFTGVWVAGEAQALSDAAEVRWLAPERFAGVPFLPGVRTAIARAKELLGL